MKGAAKKLTLREKIGRRVAFFRREAELGQKELAAKIGTDSMSISRLERGKTIPSVEKLDEIASVLNAQLVDFFDFTDGQVREHIFKRIVRSICFLDENEMETALRFLRGVFPNTPERMDARLRKERMP